MNGNVQSTSFTTYMVGEGTLSQFCEVCGRYGKRVMIVGGHKAMQAAMPKILASVKNSDIEIVAQEWYGGECTKDNMLRMKAIGEKNGCDVIVGVGGGKALDTAKGCAHFMNLPVITVPTIASTCADVTALSVTYLADGSFVGSIFYDAPPKVSMIDLSIIAAAPVRYLRAGIGDTVAKHFECAMSARGAQLNHASQMAVDLSASCYHPLVKYGVQALRDCEENRVTEELRQVVLCNCVTTGMVSLLIDEEHNGAIAHAMFYGLTALEHFEEHNLHGDAVAYGVLVQLALDGKTEEFAELRTFFAACGMPVKMADMGYVLSRDAMRNVLPAALQSLKSRIMPYWPTEDDLFTAMEQVEAAE